jgi:hypothetical protein
MKHLKKWVKKIDERLKAIEDITHEQGERISKLEGRLNGR